jgi:glycosyltransferase involved in cell wall biosynthesis
VTSGDRPRIAFVDHIAQISGGEVALIRLVEALGDRVDAHVVLGEDGPLGPALEAAGATVHVLPMVASLRETRKESVRPGALGLAALTQTTSYLRALRRLLRDIAPDVVHTNSLKSSLLAGVAARSAAIPVLWHIRDRISDDYLPMPAVWLVRGLSLVVPSAVLVNSRETASTLPARSTVVYDVVPPAPAVARHTHEGPLVVGMVGRLAPWKGQDVFLRAFARAAATRDLRAHLVGSAMFGEDAYAESLHRLCADLGIADRVDWRGFRQDIWGELALMDVLVHASVTPEPFGQVVIEGMAAGVPVIAAAAGGPAEVVTHDQDGLLVTPGDVDALATTIGRLADDPADRDRLALAGHRTSAHYSPETVAVAVLAAYRPLGRRSSGSGRRRRVRPG